MRTTKYSLRTSWNLRALCVTLLLLAASGNAQQTAQKPRIICDHAAPPRGMHYVCKSQCDCHLEGKLKNDEDGAITVPAVGNGDPHPAAACTRSAIDMVIPRVPEDLIAVNTTVALHVLVDSDGKVTKAEVLRGHQMLASSTLQSIVKWKFDPACGSAHDIEITYRTSKTKEPSGTYIRGDNVEIVNSKWDGSESSPKSKKKKLKPSS